MANNEVSSERSNTPAYIEKKCEREFRKLLHSVNSGSGNSAYCNYGDEFSEDSRKRHKSDLQDISGESNPSSDDNSFSRCQRSKAQSCEESSEEIHSEDIVNIDMAHSDASSEKIDKPAKAEKRCEREFRKLLQIADSGTTNIVYCNYDFSEKRRRRHESDEQEISSVSNPNDGTNFSHFQKCKAQNSEEYPGKINSEDNLVPSSSSVTVDTNKMEFDLQSLFKNLNQHSCLETKCKSVISLAVYCSDNLSEAQVSSVLEALNALSNTHKSDALAICHALLLFTLTKDTLNIDQIIYLEELILKLADSVMLSENGLGNKVIGSRLALLRGEHYLKAYKLCQKLFPEENLDIDAIDVLTLCCSSLKNLSSCKMSTEYKFSDSTLKFILGMTGKATQEIVAENLIGIEVDYNVRSVPSHMVNQCLQILQHILQVHPDLIHIDHEDFSLLHCLTRLLEWCMSFLFQKKHPENNPLNIQNNSLSSFHLATLVSILKILSILSFNPDQYDSFTNIKGLMEKVMICILEAYFQSEENRFDVLVLALELMINFFLKHKKTFVLLCLKKFQINSSEKVFSIEALLKILENSLNKIKEIKEKSLTVKPEENQNDDGENSVGDNLELVLEAADEDMELSTIVSFISILLAFFMDTKTSFVDFIRQRLSLEKSVEAITVSKKVLQFASLTGGMPITGILLLRHAIKKLSQLYPSGEASTDSL